MIQASNNDIKFFRPLWRRVTLLVVLVAWLGFEFFYGDSFFLMIVLFAIAYCVWTMFIKFPSEDEIAERIKQENADDQASPPDSDKQD